MSRPGSLSRVVLAAIWVVVGAGMVAAAAWVGVTRWEVVLSGHPVLVPLVVLCGLAGLVALVWSVATLAVGRRADEYAGDPAHPRRRTPQQVQRRARWRIGLAVPVLALAVLLASTVAYSRPYAATAEALAARVPSDDLLVSDTLTWYELAPAARDAGGDIIVPTVGMVFIPGARVDPRAYAPLLAPIAKAGYLVIVLKEPLGLALLDPGHAQRAMAIHPEVTAWLAAGHSLGGVVAADLADRDRRVNALLLCASYPARPMSRNLPVVTFAGSADRLAPPGELAARQGNLPPSARLIVVPGASHASFGDYGPQRGDGLATATPAAVRVQVDAIAQQLLQQITPPPPKKKKK